MNIGETTKIFQLYSAYLLCLYAIATVCTPTFGVFYVGSKYSCRSRILERKLIPWPNLKTNASSICIYCQC